jgi:hypothetical protein
MVEHLALADRRQCLGQALVRDDALVQCACGAALGPVRGRGCGGRRRGADRRGGRTVRADRRMDIAGGVEHMVEHLALADRRQCLGQALVRDDALSVGEDAVVVGAGPIGVAVALFARIAGAGRIVLVELPPCATQPSPARIAWILPVASNTWSNISPLLIVRGADRRGGRTVRADRRGGAHRAGRYARATPGLCPRSPRAYSCRHARPSRARRASHGYCRWRRTHGRTSRPC